MREVSTSAVNFECDTEVKPRTGTLKKNTEDNMNLKSFISSLNIANGWMC